MPGCIGWRNWSQRAPTIGTNIPSRATCCIRRPGHRVTDDRTSASNGAGWEFVHLAIDDHSRVAFGTIESDERGSSACRALLAAVRYCRALGVRFQRVLTDNGASWCACAFATSEPAPTPREPNGKAESLVQTALREWAYAKSYESSAQRAEAFPRWLHHYNWHRPHTGVGYQVPVSRLPIPLNNVVGLHT